MFMTGHAIFNGLYSQSTIDHESHMVQVQHDMIKKKRQSQTDGGEEGRDSDKTCKER